MFGALRSTRNCRPKLRTPRYAQPMCITQRSNRALVSVTRTYSTKPDPFGGDINKHATQKIQRERAERKTRSGPNKSDKEPFEKLGINDAVEKDIKDYPVTQDYIDEIFFQSRKRDDKAANFDTKEKRAKRLRAQDKDDGGGGSYHIGDGSYYEEFNKLPEPEKFQQSSSNPFGSGLPPRSQFKSEDYSPEVEQFVKRPIYTPVDPDKVPVEKPNFDSITDITPRYTDALDVERMKEESENPTTGKQMSFLVDPLTFQELSERFKPTSQPVKEDPVVRSAPNENIAKALAQTAIRYSEQARRTKKTIRLTPYASPTGTSSDDRSADAARTFKNNLEEIQDEWAEEKEDALHEIQDYDDYFDGFIEENMRNYFHGSVATDLETNFKLWFSTNRARITYKALRKRRLLRNLKDKAWEKFKAKRIAKYGQKNAERRERGKQARKEFADMVSKSPDWIRLEKWGYWIRKEDLLHPHIQGMVTVLDNNPSYTIIQKRKAVDLAVNFLRNAAKQAPEQVNKFREIYGDVMRKTSGQPSPPDDYMDDLAVIPKTYEQLIAAAEAEIPKEDLRRRYDPPLGDKKKRHGEY